jgi:hypothetical protein
MKKTNFLIIGTIIFLTFINTNCSTHCDDEDYTRDENEAVVLQGEKGAVINQKDTLKTFVD